MTSVLLLYCDPHFWGHGPINSHRISCARVTVCCVVVSTELFSAPTLTMSPANVFQREQMILICKSKSYASERLGEDELTYSLEEPQHFLSPKDNGVFYGKALLYEFNFTCAAKAKGITKRSQTLTVRPKGNFGTDSEWMRLSGVHLQFYMLAFRVKLLIKGSFWVAPINITLYRRVW